MKTIARIASALMFIAAPLALQSCGSDASDIVAQSLDIQIDMADTLAGVKDKDSADKAADKIASLQKKSIELAKEMTKLSPEDMAKAGASEEQAKKAQEAAQKLAPEMSRIMQNNCYGSDALRNALTVGAQ